MQTEMETECSGETVAGQREAEEEVEDCESP